MKKDLNFMPDNGQYVCYKYVKTAQIVFYIVAALFALYIIWILGSSSYYTIAQYSAQSKMEQNADMYTLFQQLKTNDAVISTNSNVMQNIKQSDFDPILYTQELEKLLPSGFKETSLTIDNQLNFTLTGTAASQDFVNNMLKQMSGNSLIESAQLTNYDNGNATITGTLNKI